MRDRSCLPRGESGIGFGDARLVIVAALFLLVLPADGVWKQRSHLFADDAVAYDVFGETVAISGDTIVVGARGDNTPAGDDAGSAYVFVSTGGTWSQQSHLFANDAAAGDQFGASVAISGDTIVVGAPEDNSSAGSAYVFVRTGAAWSQQARLSADDASAHDKFGSSVGIDGDTIAVGAEYDDTAAGNLAGSAYVFARSSGSWTQQGHLFADNATQNDFFGTSVAVWGDYVVVGAPTAFAGVLGGAGAAYVFVRSGGTWSQQGYLYADAASVGDLFGDSVAILSNTVVVGAPDDDTSSGGPDAGSVYVFTRGGSTWGQQAHLFADDAKPNDQFGGCVAITGNSVLVGAHYDDTAAATHAGSAYVFIRDGGGWVQQDHLFAYDAEVEDYFGRSVAISGQVAVVGADFDDTADGTRAGSAYVFGFAPYEIFVGPPDLTAGR
jgi:hypothetical protein